MIALTCLAFTLTVTTGFTESHVKIDNQECYHAPAFCRLRDGQWELQGDDMQEYLEFKWRDITGRKNISIDNLRCSETVFLTET